MISRSAKRRTERNSPLKAIVALVFLSVMVAFLVLIGLRSLLYQDHCDGVPMSAGDRCKHLGRTGQTLIPADEIGTGPGKNGSSISGQVSYNQLNGSIYLGVAVLGTVMVGGIAVKRIVNLVRPEADGRDET